MICACCLIKTTETINKLTNKQPSSHFFLTDPLSDSIFHRGTRVQLSKRTPVAMSSQLMSTQFMQDLAEWLKNSTEKPEIFQVWIKAAL